MLRAVIARHKGELGATMPVMQEAQEISAIYLRKCHYLNKVMPFGILSN